MDPKLQSRVGYAVLYTCCVVTAVNLMRFIVFQELTVNQALLHPSILSVAGVGVLSLYSALASNRSGQLLQCIAFFSMGLTTAFYAEAGNLTSMIFAGYAYWLALEYGFLKSFARGKAILLVVVYFSALGIGMTVNMNEDPFAVPLQFVAIGLLVYLFWLMLDLNNRRHRERESELERQVRERTASIQDRMEETERLKEELEESVAEKDGLLEEKDVLLKEVHHRTKNNMQVVASLLNLERSGVSDPAALKAIKNSTQRIHALALAHEHLYRSEDLVHIDLSLYLRSLLSDVWSSISTGEHTLDVNIDEHVSVDLDFAIPLGLVLNELVSNAAKHAFNGAASGTVKVDAHAAEGELVLHVADDGRGFPEDLDTQNPDSLGLRLVWALVSQLQGTAAASNRDIGGAEWRLNVQIQKTAE